MKPSKVPKRSNPAEESLSSVRPELNVFIDCDGHKKDKITGTAHVFQQTSQKEDDCSVHFCNEARVAEAFQRRRSQRGHHVRDPFDDGCPAASICREHDPASSSPKSVFVNAER